MWRSKARKANVPGPRPFNEPCASSLAPVAADGVPPLDSPIGLAKESLMAKGQQRSTKEKKKPKADDKVKQVSAYKQQFGKQSSQPQTIASGKK
jgi:hypothetical protein